MIDFFSCAAASSSSVFSTISAWKRVKEPVRQHFDHPNEKAVVLTGPTKSNWTILPCCAILAGLERLSISV